MADLTITAANVQQATTATVTQVIAGETITAGQLVYKDTTDSNKYKLVDNDSLASSKIGGIALNAASDGQPLGIATAGDVNPGATVVVGEIYCASSTPGGIAPDADNATGDYRSILGVGTSTSNIKLQIFNSEALIP